MHLSVPQSSHLPNGANSGAPQMLVCSEHRLAVAGTQYMLVLTPYVTGQSLRRGHAAPEFRGPPSLGEAGPQQLPCPGFPIPCWLHLTCQPSVSSPLISPPHYFISCWDSDSHTCPHCVLGAFHEFSLIFLQYSCNGSVTVPISTDKET